MKRTVGIVLLIIAAIATVNVAIKLSRQTASSHPGNRSYETGRKAGMVSVPVILGAAGLWLLLASRRRREASVGQAGTAPSTVARPVVLVIGITGILAVAVIIGLGLMGANRRAKRNFPPPVPVAAPSGYSSTPSGTTRSSPYSVDERVAANWAGKWIPGKITAINPGGFTVKVQLDDPRFPHPILLSTNQIRPE